MCNVKIACAYFQEIRHICERYTNEGLAVHPTGEVFIFWEPYFALSKSLTVALVVISFAVFITISILLFNPWTGSLLTTLKRNRLKLIEWNKVMLTSNG